MKNYTITVNGNIYDVTVEENTSGAQTVAKQITPQMAVPKVATTTTAAAIGAHKIDAGAAGKVFKIEAQVGQQVKKGDTIIILEAMKMEIPVVAPLDGTIASIVVAAGEAVEAGSLLATLN